MDNDRPVSIIINKLENLNFSDFAGLIRDAIAGCYIVEGVIQGQPVRVKIIKQ